MKLYRPFLYSLILTLALSSCYEEPNFPVEPRITGTPEIIFIEDPSGADSLVVRISFEDGDGDLGLSGDELDPEFSQPYTILRGPNGEKYYYFDDQRDEFNCEEFDIAGVYQGDTINDTVKVAYNKYYNNFEIKLFRKVDGNYEEFNFRKELCVAPLSGRFPYLKEDFSDTKPLEGIIEYRYRDNGSRLINLFRNDTLKIEVQIRDRAKHESNVTASESFTLRGQQRPPA